MGEVTLSGQLVCATFADAEVVERLLPEHVELTRAEAGCLAFAVTRRAESCVWDVEERFDSEDSFRAHQARVAESEWGRETAAIERNYTIVGIAP
jgi:quinol monooxygenase YgiN